MYGFTLVDTFSAAGLIARGHEVGLFEPGGAWSLRNLLTDSGPEAVERFRLVYPELEVRQSDLSALDLERALDGVDMAVAHE